MQDLQRVDDLRLAVDELAAAAIAASPPGARLHVEIRASKASIGVRGRVQADGAAPTLSRVGRMLVTSIGRAHHRELEDGEIVFDLVVDGSRTREA